MSQYYLLKALDEAYKRRGFTAPNPAVGAVVVSDNKIIASGTHWGPGHAHAERHALSKLPRHVTRGTTLYVTLEPCCHEGRTPACTDAIIEAGVSRVVYAMRDPNLPNATRGHDVLSAHGIEVVHEPLPEIDAFYEAYCCWLATKRPFVIAKLALSKDDDIAYLDGNPAVLSGPEAAQFTHQQRLYADVILTTATTVLNDDPALNVRLGDKRIAKPVCVLDSKQRLTGNERLFKTAEKVFCLNEGHQDLNHVIASLGEQGYHQVWVEVGATALHALLEQALVQRLILYKTPTKLAAPGLKASIIPTNFNPKTTQSCALGQDIVVQYDFCG